MTTITQAKRLQIKKFSTGELRCFLVNNVPVRISEGVYLECLSKLSEISQREEHVYKDKD